MSGEICAQLCHVAGMASKTTLVRDGETPGEQLTRELSFEIRADRIDDGRRTVELTFSSEEPYERWWGTEVLDHSAGAVRLDRLNAGGALLMDHNTRDQIGVVERAWLDDRKGRAIVRFGRSARAAEIFQDVKDGIRKLVSVGYRIHDLVLERSNDEGETYRAQDWEPFEISLVAVPADPTVGVGRDGEPAGFDPRTLLQKENDMPQARNANPGGDRAPASHAQVYRDGNPSRSRVVSSDQILRACSRANLSRDAERALLEANEAEPMTEQRLFDEIVDALQGQRNVAPINQNRAPGGGGAQMREAFADALISRLTGAEPTERAMPYVGASLVDMARALLERDGQPVRWFRPSAVVDQISRGAFHTTSDFAWIVDSATNQFLNQTFAATASPLKPLARRRNLNDFKPAHGVRVEGDVDLLLVAESGEFKRGTVVESKDQIKLDTYGRILGVTRQAIINDDLSVFSELATFFARAAAEHEASFLAALISGDGVTLSDGLPLYHVNRGNKATTGGAISETTLSEGREAMRNMKNLDGRTFANITPRYLVTGPALETQAQKILASLSPTKSSDVNPFASELSLVVDPRLTGKSWRLFADPAQHPVLHWASLEGQGQLYTETRVGFDVDGVEVKARVDVGAAAWDWRGSFLNSGE